MRIENVTADQGARLRGRCEAADHPGGLYCSVWFYIPEHHETPDGWWNIFQIKSRPLSVTTGGSDPMWVLDLLDRGNGTMRLRLRDKIVEGTTVNHGTAPIDFPIGEWVHVEMFFRGGANDDGAIRVWQDGVALWSFADFTTNRPDSDIRWAVNNYTAAISPDPSTIYVDDASSAACA